VGNICSLCMYEVMRFNETCNVHTTEMTNPQSLAILWTTGLQNFQTIFIYVLESENSDGTANYSKKWLGAN
jgi:hypothetical protein